MPDDREAAIDASEILELLRRTEELLDRGRSVAGQLRAAADAADSGRPGDLDLESATGWVREATGHLDDLGRSAMGSRWTHSGSLHAAREMLDTAARDLDDYHRRRATAVDIVASYRANGLDHLIPQALQPLGFASEEEIHAGTFFARSDTGSVLDGTGPASGPIDVVPAQPKTVPGQPDARPAPADSVDVDVDVDAGKVARAEDAAAPEPTRDDDPAAGIDSAADDDPAATIRSLVGERAVDRTTPEAAEDDRVRAAEHEVATAPVAPIEPIVEPEPADRADTGPAPERPAAPKDIDGLFRSRPPRAESGIAGSGPASPVARYDASARAAAPKRPAPTATPTPPPRPEPAAPRRPATAPIPEQVRANRGPESEAMNYPWDTGAPPHIASLLTARADAAAVLLAEAANETAQRNQILRFFCAAFTCSPTYLSLELSRVVPTDAAVAELHTDEARVLLAGAVRSGLSLGYFPVSIPTLIERSALEPGIREIIEMAREAGVRGLRLGNDADSGSAAGSAAEWEAAGEEASNLLDTLSKKVIKFELATKVLHHMARPGQLIGTALTAMRGLSDGGIEAADFDDERWREVFEAAEILQDRDGRDRLIDTTTKELVDARRKKIIAGARRSLDNNFAEVGDMLVRFIELRDRVRSSSAHHASSADQLATLVESYRPTVEPNTVGEAALLRLLNWMADPSEGQSRGVPLATVLNEGLEPLFELERDEMNEPVRPATLAELSLLFGGRDAVTVVSGYLDSGNIAAARHYVAEHGLPMPEEAFGDQAARAEHRARERHNAQIETMRWLAARHRALYEDDRARDLTSQMQSLLSPDPERYDLADRELHGLIEDGRAHLNAYRDNLRAQVRALDAAAEDKDRLLALIDAADEVLAVDFLTRLQAGSPLPAIEAETADDFTAFFPRVVEAATAAQAKNRRVVTAVRSLLRAPGAIENRHLDQGLRAWEELRETKRSGQKNEFRLLVAHVLRMIGLVPPSQSWLRDISNTQRAGFAAFEAKAAPVDRSYVPALGTQSHGRYDLTLVWHNVSPTRLLEYIPESRRTRPNIILYFGVLDTEQRRNLRALATPGKGRGFSPLVVDDAVIAWLSTRPEPGWRFTQRVTLPFTAFNPYTPFAGGEVPDEVFVGREVERAAIESPTGPMFVYGGRQLGKSALLRRVERMFNDPPEVDENNQKVRRTGRIAVYIDLKAAAIGEMLEPTKLWGELAERLKSAGVTDVGRGSSEEVVSRYIREWLAADDSNRLLLLLDEADNFLTADSRHGRNTGKSAEFPTLQGLKKLMESSNRRLKPVFAGLHQVQRFQDLPNTPIGHGGQEILIGPLRSQDAYDLVVDPMRALGYTFQSPDVVWRLLLYTNYQASLVQILCDALVRRMQTQQLPPSGGRIEITAQHVDAVYAERDVRDLIVQRFRWTINLDARYRIIALVVALNSMDAEPGASFSVSELREQCETFWEEGFAREVLPEARFVSYLDEMVGLGVLHRRDQNTDSQWGEDSYGLRSPHILGLLGTRHALDRELSEAPTLLELPHEYNPRMNRRVLGGATRISSRRSSLTDFDLAILLKRDKGVPKVRVVTGSDALGRGRVVEALTGAAREQNLQMHLLGPGDMPADPAEYAQLPRDLLIDLGHGPSHDLTGLTRALGARGNGTTVIVAGPGCLPFSPPSRAVTVVPLRRWSMEELRFWHETPFNSPELREQLHYVTSGWPDLVEEAMEHVNNGRQPKRALELVAASLRTHARAVELLDTSGADRRVVTAWAQVASTSGGFGLADPIPVSDADLTEILDGDPRPALEMLAALDLVAHTEDGWALDRVALTAAGTLLG
ncbi:AAA family ATPase [Nocardia higoensis]|uniref:AAA family ATPase n=1 Tax=Nocardia higoensis TaxID=228599 RepID=UPI0002F5F37B|nr:AAA family ATPase [Nocardia higoensis]